MANPAQLLLIQLQLWYGPTQTADQARETGGPTVWYQHRLAVRQLNALDEILREMGARGKDVAVWEGAFEVWTQAVFAWPRGWGAPKSGAINKTALEHLRTLASWLDDYLPQADQEGLERTGSMVDDILDAVNSDASLPVDMKIHLRQMCDQVRWCVDRYTETGDFELKVAIDRLLITVGQCAQQGYSPSFRDRVTMTVNTFVYPFVVGTLAQVTGGAILSVLGLDGGDVQTAIQSGHLHATSIPSTGGGGGST